MTAESPVSESSASRRVANDQSTLLCENTLDSMQCTGILSHTVSQRTGIILICDRWPSWFFIFRTLNLSCSTIFMPNTSLPWIPIFQRLHHTVSIESISSFSGCPRSVLPLQHFALCARCCLLVENTMACRELIFACHYKCFSWLYEYTAS